MVLLGLTGGIASGKSTVAKLLTERGAILIDADEISRDVVRGGQPAFDAIVTRFGDSIKTDDGELDRAALASIVFNDKEALRDLEEITHPAIFAEIVDRVEAVRDKQGIVILDAALIVEKMPDRGRSFGVEALIVVNASPEDQLERMVRDRSMDRPMAESRMAAQSRAIEKIAAADYVLDNRGTIDDLKHAVAILWQELTSRFANE